MAEQKSQDQISRISARFGRFPLAIFADAEVPHEQKHMCQIFKRKKERDLAASFLSLPVGLADLVIEIDARPDDFLRQQRSAQNKGKRPHPKARPV